MSKIRSEVIKVFRKLHKTRKFVFAGDDRALAAARREINKQFKKNALETDSSNIKSMIKVAEDVDKELRTNVIQAKQKEDGIFAVRITEETTRLDNVPFNIDAEIVAKPRKGKRSQAAGETGCCGGGTSSDPPSKPTKPTVQKDNSAKKVAN